MARIQRVIDDLTGDELDEDVEPTVVSVDGTKYNLDLGSASKDRLLKWLNGEGALVPEKNRSSSGGSGRSKKRSGTRSGPSANDVRMWGHENGVVDSGRGRVGVDLKDAYNKAHPDNPYN